MRRVIVKLWLFAFLPSMALLLLGILLNDFTTHLWSALLVAGISFGTTFVTSKSIQKGMNTLTEGFKKAHEVNGSFTGLEDFKELLFSFNQMLEHLKNKQMEGNKEELEQFSNKVDETSGRLTLVTADIIQEIEQFSQSIEMQAMQVASTTAAVEEMVLSIQQVDENNQAAEKIADKSASIAQSGRIAVTNTIKKMHRINEVVGNVVQKIRRLGDRSQEVGTIVKAIKDIADRTNMLSLNTAIEAARAGEQGKGFAVVAREVRKLSEKSSTQTIEIAGLIRSIQAEIHETVSAIEAMVKEVESGMQLADDAGKALKEVVQVTNQISQQVQEAKGHLAAESEQIARSILATILKPAAPGSAAAFRGGSEVSG